MRFCACKEQTHGVQYAQHIRLMEKDRITLVGIGCGDWGLVSNLYNDMRVVKDTSLMTTPIQASAHSHEEK